MESFHHILISLFIIAYFGYTALCLWTKAPAPLKPSDPLCRTLADKLGPFGTLSGLEQYWALFSPNVKTENAYNLVVITFQNGLLKLYELPRMEKLNMFEKARQEKFRKLFNDNFHYPTYTVIRPAVSRFLSRANYKLTNVPVRISYFLISDPITSPNAIFFSRPIESIAPRTRIENYFVYGISPEDL